MRSNDLQRVESVQKLAMLRARECGFSKNVDEFRATISLDSKANNCRLHWIRSKISLSDQRKQVTYLMSYQPTQPTTELNGRQISAGESFPIPPRTPPATSRSLDITVKDA